MPSLLQTCHRRTFAVDPLKFNRLVCKLAIKHGADKARAEDSDQYANGWIGLMSAIKYFDPTRKVKFISYAWLCIEREIRDGAKRADTQHSKAAFQINEIEADGIQSREPDHEKVITDRELARLALKQLGERDRELMRLRHCEGLTLRAAGARLGISHERSRQLEQRALGKIRERMAG